MSEKIIRAYFDAIIPDGATGYLFVAVGYGPHLNEHGKYAHKRWEEYPFGWPSKALEVVAKIQAEAPLGDVYVCPYVMRDRHRAKGNAAGHQLAHSDVDSGQLDPDINVVHGLGGFVIASGTPGHGHVYLPLKHAVTAAQHELLCKGLAAHLGGDVAKVSDNDLLRPPGTFNYKPTVTGGDPAPVGPEE